jgi:chemotaxis-related protein WspB
MLFLKFQLGDEICALEAGQIVEILQLLTVTRILQAPAGIAGLIDYRGDPVPVIDLSELALGRPARPHISTRLIIVRYAATHLLGLIVEQATDTLRREAQDFTDTGIACDSAPYLGPVTRDGGRLIRRIDIQKVLPAALGNALFRAVDQAACSLALEDACPTTTLPPS